MSGWTKKELETEGELTAEQGTAAGFEAVINYYQTFRDSLPKNKTVENLIKMKEKGTLPTYIHKSVAQ